MPYKAQENELEILKYWQEHKCFEKSVESRPEDKPYVFYDGPPFATGLPHYGHIVASLMKDVVPRYWTMKGFRVERKWGWDCHGLPIENIIEKELDLSSKKDIEAYGIGKFNEACRATVLKYAEEWKKTVARMGRWADMENDYKTMDLSFMESVWWVFKELWNKDLVYKGHKAMHVCPRCVTPLSNFEVTQGYKDVQDISVTAKFKVKQTDKAQELGLPADTYILAWTTTPWTLPGNVLLAVGGDIEYVIVKWKDPDPLKGDAPEEYCIVSKDIFDFWSKNSAQDFKLFTDKKITLNPERLTKAFFCHDGIVKKELKGSDLLGLEYEPLFPYFKDTENAFRIVEANFVTTEDGTGVVHIAPAFGQDDYEVGKREQIELVQHVGMDGRFVPEVTDFAGMEVKPKDDPTSTDVAVLKYLAAKGLIFSKQKFEHSYPHCWRCDSPLLNYATDSWFVKVTELKDQLTENNREITWVPEHIKEGRFGEWLAGARDWAVSRNRFWGTPLPVWESEDGDAICVGSAKELEKLSGQKIDDLHKHKIDDIEIKKDGKVYRRIPEVLDCWFESGSMPYGQMHYPFENREKFEAGFPAQFIAEGQDQTRGWFYTLHVLATALTMGDKKSIPTDKSRPAFKNVIVNGIILAEDGKKMSKRLRNYPDPTAVMEKYGADAMRYYLATSPAMEAESLNFSEDGVREVYNRVINTLWNVFAFYRMFAAGLDKSVDPKESENKLDKWILAKLNALIGEVSREMEAYRLVKASRPIADFVVELSIWYVRRSRDRFKGEDEKDRKMAIATLRRVLIELAKVMAPFMPFMSEKIYLELEGGKESVHLEDWPEAGEISDEKLLSQMDAARKICELGHFARKESQVKVRQPLSLLKVKSGELEEGLGALITDELNVKAVEFASGLPEGEGWQVAGDDSLKVALNLEITEELKKEGMLRELVRHVNSLRKGAGMTIEDKARIKYSTESDLIKDVLDSHKDQILRETLSVEISEGEGEEVELNSEKILISIEKA